MTVKWFSKWDAIAILAGIVAGEVFGRMIRYYM